MTQSLEHSCSKPEQQSANSSPYQSVAAEGYSAQAPTSFEPANTNASNFLPSVEITTGSGQSKDSITLNFGSLPPGTDVNINISQNAKGQETISISDTNPNSQTNTTDTGTKQTSSGASSDSGTKGPNPPSGSDSGTKGPNPPSDSDSGTKGPNPPSGSDSGTKGPNPPSDSGSGTTASNPPSDSGSGTTASNPPPSGSSDGGITGGGATSSAPPSGGATDSGDTSTTIQGVTSANNAQLAAENSSLVNGNLNGPDALHLASSNSGLQSVNPAGQGYSQMYGYYEADLKLENGGSGWPGWWLESVAHATNPTKAESAEIDIMEAQTGNPNGKGDTQFDSTVHESSTVDGTTPGTTDHQTGATTETSNLSSGYNWYGVLNQPGDPNLEFYFDGKQVASVPKYSDSDTPMMMNLDNITGGWANAPSSTPTGDMDVKAVLGFESPGNINSTDLPGGTLGTTLTNVTAAEAPPVAGMINTFASNFTNGGISVSGDGAPAGQIWSDATPQYPYEPWNDKGISSGPA